MYVIDAARTSLVFLKEMQSQWEETVVHHRDGSDIKKRQRIVADAFVIYVASLFDRTCGTHSLARSYLSHPFIGQFKQMELVQKCIEHRNKRAGHQSEYYGFIVPLDMILSSDIDMWLSDAAYAIATHRLPLKKQK